MKKKINKTTEEVVYLTVNNKYINELTEYLIKCENNRQSVTTPESHKQIIFNKGTVDEYKTKFTRPYVCFNYTKDAKFLKCFPLGTYKKNKDRRNDSRFYYLDSDSGKTLGKIIVVKPIYIPTIYLNVINFKAEQKLARCANEQLISWLSALEKEYKICKQDKKIIYKQYNDIKFGRKVGEIDYSFTKLKYLINESLVYQFCQLELEKIEKYEETHK